MHTGPRILTVCVDVLPFALRIRSGLTPCIPSDRESTAYSASLALIRTLLPFADAAVGTVGSSQGDHFLRDSR
jgi:hypothetical protein